MRFTGTPFRRVHPERVEAHAQRCARMDGLARHNVFPQPSARSWPTVSRVPVASASRRKVAKHGDTRPPSSRLCRAVPPGKLRLRQRRRRAGANLRLNQRELVVGPSVLLPELGVLHETN